MGNRLVPAILLVLLAVIHVQLWSGRGSVPRVAQMRQDLAAQNTRNEQAHQANERLAAEVSDLKEGQEMVEERARYELGMLKPNEIYVHVSAAPITVPPPPTPTKPTKP